MAIIVTTGGVCVSRCLSSQRTNIRRRSRIDKRSVEFSTGSSRAHSRILIAKIRWNRATKRSAFTSPLSPYVHVASVTRVARLLHACKRELSTRCARSSNAWPLSCRCNQNVSRERERERGCTSVKINNMSLKIHTSVSQTRRVVNVGRVLSASLFLFLLYFYFLSFSLSLCL